MENAQLISLSRQVALQRQMDVVANNIANLNTTGFKAENLLFEEYIMPTARDNDFPTLDKPLSYTQDWATINNFATGTITQTGNPYDIALDGGGFLVVDTPDGERYTRNGSLQINNKGVLVTLEGYPILSVGGQIAFTPDDTNVTIAANGNITTDQGSNGQLRIVEFADLQSLKRQSASLFAGEDPARAVNTRVRQGFIERSNVHGVQEMTEMIRITRAYTSIASLMDKQDELRRTAIRKLGTLN